MKRTLAIATITAICLLGLMDIVTVAGRQAGSPITGGGQSIGGTGITQGSVAQCSAAMPSDASGLQNQIRNMQTKVHQDQAALRHLKLQNRASEFNRWQKLTQCAKTDLQGQMIDIGVSHLFDNTKSYIHEMGVTKHVLDASTARRLIIEWKKAGFGNSNLYRLVSGLAGTKPGKRQLENLVEGVHRARDAWNSELRKKALEREEGCSSSWLESSLQGAGTLLNWFAPEAAGPYLEAAHFTVFGGYDAATYYASKRNVERLGKLTDQQLKVVNMLKDRLVSDVGCLRQTQATLAHLQQPNTARPKARTQRASTGHAVVGKTGGGSHALPIVLGAVAAGGAAAYYAGTQLKNGNCGTAANGIFCLQKVNQGFTLDCPTQIQADTAWCQCEGYSSYNLNSGYIGNIGGPGSAPASQICQ